MKDHRVCEECGNDRFSEGVLGKSGYDKVKNPDKVFHTGSNLILTFCNECGYVAALHVEKPKNVM